MQQHQPILGPVIVLVLWTLVMTIWMYATRIPAISKYRLSISGTQTYAEFQQQFPAEVRWKSENLNNLMEQPTIFYAICIVLAVAKFGSGVNVTLAWAYVIIRIVHSLVHSTINHVHTRFTVFIVGTVVLGILTCRAAYLIL